MEQEAQSLEALGDVPQSPSATIWPIISVRRHADYNEAPWPLRKAQSVSRHGQLAGALLELRGVGSRDGRGLESEIVIWLRLTDHETDAQSARGVAVLNHHHFT